LNFFGCRPDFSYKRNRFITPAELSSNGIDTTPQAQLDYHQPGYTQVLGVNLSNKLYKRRTFSNLKSFCPDFQSAFPCFNNRGIHSWKSFQIKNKNCTFTLPERYCFFYSPPEIIFNPCSFE